MLGDETFHTTVPAAHRVEASRWRSCALSEYLQKSGH
jgi:hypothetical protein